MAGRESAARLLRGTPSGRYKAAYSQSNDAVVEHRVMMLFDVFGLGPDLAKDRVEPPCRSRKD